MTAYEPSEWSDLFVAVAGASAALAGLVFVAISINIERILAFEGLPERGAETVIQLVGVLVVAIVGLVPGQGHLALGLELVVVAGALGASLSALPSGGGQQGEPAWHRPARVLLRSFGPLLMLAGAISVAAAAGGGLYWIVAGILVATLGAVSNAWVLLVEILR